MSRSRSSLADTRHAKPVSSVTSVRLAGNRLSRTNRAMKEARDRLA